MKTPIKRSWHLLKVSVAVVKKSPKLLIFPLISGVTGFIVISPFLISFLVLIFEGMISPYPETTMLGRILDNPVLEQLSENHASDWTVITTLISSVSLKTLLFYGGGGIILSGFLLYLLLYVQIFCQVAFIVALSAHFRDESFSIKRAITEAWALRKEIRNWAALTAFVNLVLALLEILGAGVDFLEKTPWVGRLVADLIISFAGITWNLATFFVLPIMVYEKLSVREACRRSSMMLRERWGEMVIGFVSINGIIGIAVLIPILVGFSLFFGSVLIQAYWNFHFDPFHFIIVGLAIAFLGALIIGLIGVGVIDPAAKTIFRTALYIYTIEGVVPSSYSKELLDETWIAQKKSHKN